MFREERVSLAAYLHRVTQGNKSAVAIVQVRPVTAGTATLKDATSEAIRDWVTNVEDTHYILGSVAGPHPYPMMVRDFHAVIGEVSRPPDPGVRQRTLQTSLCWTTLCPRCRVWVLSVF